MTHAILVLNAGSSSLKFAIYHIAERDLVLIARGEVQNLGGASNGIPIFIGKDRRGTRLVEEEIDAAATHRDAFLHLSKWAHEKCGNELQVVGIGHRVVHGADQFIEPTLLNDRVIADLEALTPLAPLHQPHSLEMIRAVSSIRPDLPQVACFDTAFHRGRAAVTERFALPHRFFEAGIRRWGFHGLSYASVMEQLTRIAPEVAAGRVVVAHLGSGASLCAISEGKSIDTTMGFSTLDGLPMGTRCGSLDPGVLLFLLKDHSPAQIEALLYRESGLLGLSGISNDVRDLLESDHPLAAEAIDFFVYQTMREIGSMAAAMGGLDALVFTAGIGENSPVIRRRICEKLGWLGIALEPSVNERDRLCISPAGRSPSVWVVPCAEDRAIAAGTLSVINAKSPAGAKPAALGILR